MAKIKIKVADLYMRRELYKYIPENVFDILEQAFIQGSEYCEIEKEEYEKIMEEANSEKQN